MAKTIATEIEELKEIYRLNPVTKHNAVEVAIDGDDDTLREAIKRLKSSHKSMKAIVVPKTSMENARNMLKNLGVSATIIDISGTYREYVANK